jgi:putative endonuclease
MMIYRGMEQLVARWAHIRQKADTGSSPVPATKMKATVGRLHRFMPFHVYVLHSARLNKIYIGFTSDLNARLLSHNELATKGWTIRFRPWSLIYSEPFATKAEARRREKELKSAVGRNYIRERILQARSKES